MADEVSKLSGKLGIDTTDFKTAIAAANREIRVLESGFKANAAALADWTKDASGLELRMKSLTGQIDIQKSKVAALSAEHARLVEENGENSRAAQDAEIKLNKETETLNKMEGELSRTESALQEMSSGSEEAGDAAQEMGGQVEESSSKVETFKSVLSGVGTVVKTTVGIVLGLATAVAAVGAAIGGLVFSSASASADLVDLSAKTGISTTRLQELDFISHQVGTSLDTIATSQAKLTRSMFAAQEGTKAQKEAFEALGVSVVDSNGELRNQQDVFDETIDALGRVENPALRDALAMEIFGRSALELNPLIKAGSDEMERLAEQAHEVGAVMSEEDVAALEAFDDTLAAMQDGLKGTLGTLSTFFLPGFIAVFDQIGGYLKTFTDIVSGSNGDFGKIAEGLTGLVTQIATDIAQQAPQMLEAGLAIVQSILDAITSALPQMLEAGISILTSLIKFIVENLPTLLQAGVEILLTLVDAIVENLPMLIDAALLAIITLANGLAGALPELVPAIVEAVITIVNALVENIPMLVEAALALILGLAEGLIAALPILIAAIPPLVAAIVEALIEALPMIATAAGQLVGMLVYGILANLPLLLTGVGSLVATILTTLEKLPQLVLDIGKNIVMGLIDGIASAKDLLFDTVTNMANDMIASIEDALGMQSPSRRGRGIGRNLFQSVGLGALDVLPSMNRLFASTANQLALAAARGASGPVQHNVDSSTQNSFDIFGNVIVQGSTTPDSFGEALKAKRY